MLHSSIAVSQGPDTLCTRFISTAAQALSSCPGDEFWGNDRNEPEVCPKDDRMDVLSPKLLCLVLKDVSIRNSSSCVYQIAANLLVSTRRARV